MRIGAGALGLLLLASCGAGAPSYAACSDDLDCSDAEDACYRLRFTRSDGSEADGTLCSRGCAADGDCPAEGLCVTLAGDPTRTGFCAAPCSAPGDCYADFACTRVEAMALSLCLP